MAALLNMGTKKDFETYSHKVLQIIIYININMTE